MLAAIIIAFACLAIIWSFASKRKPLPGFREIVESPKDKARFFRGFQPEKGLSSYSRWRINWIIRHYIKSQGQTPEFWQLIHLGERAIPGLIRVLKNDANYRSPPPRPGQLFNKSPAERAIEILSRFDLPELDSYYIRMASAEDCNLRYTAAVQLGQRPTILNWPVLTKLFEDPENHVVHGALIGIRHGIRKQKFSDALAPALRALLSSALDRDLDCTLKDIAPAALLLSIGKTHALDVLLSPRILSPNNPQIASIVELLAENKIAIPQESFGH